MMAFGGPTVAQLYLMAKLMNPPGRIVDVTSFVGTNNVSRNWRKVDGNRCYASAPVQCVMAEIPLLGTDRLHDTHECLETTSFCAET